LPQARGAGKDEETTRRSGKTNKGGSTFAAAF
jgi:hypothetical protein